MGNVSLWYKIRVMAKPIAGFLTNLNARRQLMQIQSPDSSSAVATTGCAEEYHPIPAKPRLSEDHCALFVTGVERSWKKIGWAPAKREWADRRDFVDDEQGRRGRRT